MSSIYVGPCGRSNGSPLEKKKRGTGGFSRLGLTDHRLTPLVQRFPNGVERITITFATSPPTLRQVNS